MYDPADLAQNPILQRMSVGPMSMQTASKLPIKKTLTPGMGLYQVLYWPKQAPDKSKPWCVVNLQTGDVNGRWHPSKEEALAQARALYAQLGDKAKVQGEDVVHNAFFLFADAATLVADDGVKWVEAIMPKTYKTPAYGEVVVTPEKIKNFIQNINTGIRGQDIAINYEHGQDPAKGKKAAGWIKSARTNDRGNLELAVDFTDPAKSELKNKEWRYFSLEWDDAWEHPDGIMYQDVVVGAALTNRPVAKGLMPINFSEIFTVKDDAQLAEQLSETTDLTESVTPDQELSEEGELEHSQPGTGSPPVPRLASSGADDPDRTEGWRRETPPFDDPPQVGRVYERVSNDEITVGFSEEEAVGYLTAAIKGLKRIHTNQGDTFVEDIERLLSVNRASRSFNELQRLTSEVRSYLRGNKETPKTSEFAEGGRTVGELTDNDLRELRNVLGVEDDGQIMESIKTKFGELAALRDSVSASDQERIFAEQYPQFYAEHLKLVEDQRSNGARAFAESVSKIKKAEGFGLKTTKQGLSVKAQEKIQDAHRKFSENRGTVTDFEECLREIVNGGIVQLGEIGTSEGDEVPEVDTTGPLGIANARKAFAEVVARIKRDNPEMDDRVAFAEAARKAPDLAEAYSITLPA